MRQTEIIFVRHGQTRSNIEGLLHGRTDEPLNALGLQQAERVAERLGELGLLRSIHSSPLSRARVTAEAISNRTGAGIRLHHDLGEYHFGDFEGFTFSQIESAHPEIYRRMFQFQDLEFRFPNGESRREFHARVLQAVRRILDEEEHERLVVVAHEGVIASAVSQLLGRDPNDWTRNRLENCSITRLEVNGTSVAQVICWNDTLHLAEQGTDR